MIASTASSSSDNGDIDGLDWSASNAFARWLVKELTNIYGSLGFGLWILVCEGVGRPPTLGLLDTLYSSRVS
jgi:hypothetical protein